MVDHSSAKKADADDSYTQQHETITSSSRIATLLRPVMQCHTTITATLLDSNQFFNTALLDVTPDKGTLLIDELKPNMGHDHFLTTKNITLTTMHEGVEISFTTALKKYRPENGLALYELVFPESIRYLQRRNTFRVPVSGASIIEVEIHTKNKQVYSGELSDISAEGMCVRFPKKKENVFENSSEENICVIKLPGKQQIKCAFKICHAVIHNTSNNLHIGGNFERTDKIQRRTIERFVIELQRENRKKMTR